MIHSFSHYRLHLLLVLNIIIFSISNSCNAQLIVDVKDFGAAGDGIQDDYPAFQAAVHKLNEHKSGTLLIPKGTYCLDAYNQPNSQKKHLVLKNMNQLEILGEEGTIISVKGDFHRSYTNKGKKHKFSKYESITPLIIRQCRNVKITNLEIDGNIDEMTKDDGVAEGNGHGLMFIDNENVVIKNVYLHHNLADGLNIKKRNKDLENKNYVIENVISKYNGRQGMTIGGLDDAIFKNCDFSDTGITHGNYGNHAPCAGVDIEPIHGHLVNNITFENCIFYNNIGSELVVSHVKTTTDINFIDCYFASNESSNRKWEININANGVNFHHCEFELKNGSIYPLWHAPGSKSSFTDCLIKSNSSGMVAVTGNKSTQVKVDNCKFIYTGNKKIKTFFPYIRMEKMEFTNNTIFIPSKFLKNEKASSMIENAKIVGYNLFKTDKAHIKPNVSYKNSKILE